MHPLKESVSGVGIRALESVRCDEQSQDATEIACKEHRNDVRWRVSAAALHGSININNPLRDQKKIESLGRTVVCVAGKVTGVLGLAGGAP